MTFSQYHPLTLMLYFLCVDGAVMFCMNPVLALLSLIGSVVLVCLLSPPVKPAVHLSFLALFVLTALLNPLFSHNGATVLFMLNSNPVTLEALVYGVVAAAVIVSVIYWFRALYTVMTADRLLYLVGRLSPKAALLLSMTLRFIPMFARQTGLVNNAQKALGHYGDDALSTLRCRARVFSVMSAWALENGIITADSMAARGYGIGRRTSFTPWRLTKNDAMLLCAVSAAFLGMLPALCTGSLAFTFYPELKAPTFSTAVISAYVCYAVLAFMPLFIEIQRKIRWKYLQSKI